MDQVIAASLGVAHLASDISGVPWLGTAASAVAAIQASCQKVAMHKKKCLLISDKSAALLNLLYERASNIEGPEMRQAADQVTAVLERVRARVCTWAQYNRMQAFLKDSKIEDGIRQCETELETALTSFHMSAQIVMNHNQLVMMQMVERNHDEWRTVNTSTNEEIRKMVSQVLQNVPDLQFAAELNRKGKPAAQRIMEVGQQLLAERPRGSQPREREQWKKGLVELQRLTGIPPTIKRLDGEVTKLGDMPVEKGGHSQVWQGLWLNEKKVALKVLQGVAATERAEARFVNEIRIWARLDNPHIQPLYGIVMDMGPFIHTVSPWQDNGNLLDYVRKTPDADKVNLLLGAAKGLAYLHEEQIVHGNVRCANILVTLEGEACICDFGMSKVIGEITDTPASATLTTAGSTRWLAPELIFDDKMVIPTFACDTWSFAMSMLECFTERPPWEDVRRDAHIIQAMEKQSRWPTRPQNIESPTDDVWDLMLECWRWIPARRPSMKDVALRLQIHTPDSPDSMQTDSLL